MGNMGKLPTKDKWFLEYDFSTHFPHPISRWQPTIQMIPSATNPSMLSIYCSFSRGYRACTMLKYDTNDSPIFKISLLTLNSRLSSFEV